MEHSSFFLETFRNAWKFHIKLNEQCYIGHCYIILKPGKQHSIKGCTQASSGSDTAPLSTTTLQLEFSSAQLTIAV